MIGLLSSSLLPRPGQGSKAGRLAIREFDHSGCSNGGSGKANIAYLISHPRPIAEGLRPRRKNIADEFRRASSA
jgi:hypothetical protein